MFVNDRFPLIRNIEKVVMKKIYCLDCNKYRKFLKPKIYIPIKH